MGDTSKIEASMPVHNAGLLSVVIPVYNDADCISPFVDRVTPILNTIKERFSYDWELLFVMDPSQDRTKEAILRERAKSTAVKLITSSRRFGQQPAILAGLFHCRGEACIVMDVDLQDPPELMIEMMTKHVLDRFNVVYAVRTKKLGEPLLRRVIASIGYYLMNKLSDVNIPRNVGDFRLVDRRVIEELRKLNEHHAFFRGLVPFVGFKQTGVPFERQARDTGQTKYNPIFGSIANGMNALVCFSNKLLNLSVVIGFVLFLLSIICSVVVVYLKFVTKLPFASGIPSLMILIIFTAGVQALLLGILGSYVGRIYDETKRRPLFIVDEKHGFDEGK